MAKMGFTAAAHDLGAVHAMGVIGGVDDAAFADGFVKARPAAAAFEFGIAAEQRVTAYGTIECSDVFGVLQRAAPGAFRPSAAGDLVNIFWQDLFPLLVAHAYGGGVGMRVNGVVLPFCRIVAIHITCFLRVIKAVGRMGRIASLEQAGQQGQNDDARFYHIRFHNQFILTTAAVFKFG